MTSAHARRQDGTLFRALRAGIRGFVDARRRGAISASSSYCSRRSSFCRPFRRRGRRRCSRSSPLRKAPLPRVSTSNFQSSSASHSHESQERQRAVHRVSFACRRQQFSRAAGAGSTTYTEEQARRNFDRVQRLVVPGEPLKSILLMNPLAEEAGGSHWHGGGKHWTSQSDPEWQALAAWVSTKAAPAAAPGLDFENFKIARAADPHQRAKRQRAVHRVSFARRRQQYLEPLSPGARPTPMNSRAGTSSASSGWSCPESR